MQLRPRLKNNQKPPQHKHPKSREISQNLNGNTQQTFELLLPPAAELSMADRKLLKDFHKRISFNMLFVLFVMKVVHQWCL